MAQKKLNWWATTNKVLSLENIYEFVDQEVFFFFYVSMMAYEYHFFLERNTLNNSYFWEEALTFMEYIFILFEFSKYEKFLAL